MAVAPPILDNNQDTMLPFGGAMEPPGTPESPEPQVNPAPAQAQSILGAEVPPGQPIPADKMNEAGKKEFHETMRGFEQRDAANRGAMLALDPSDPDYLKKLGAHQAQEGMLKSEQAHFQKMHPWGSEESAHPGVLGKIGHVASEIGQVAGSAVAPGVVASIPGTQANLGGKVAAGQAEEAAGTEQELKAAETGKAEREPEGKNVTPDEQVLAAGTRIAQGIGTPQDLALVKSYHDLTQLRQKAITPNQEGTPEQQLITAQETLRKATTPEEKQAAQAKVDEIKQAINAKNPQAPHTKEDLQAQIVKAQNTGDTAEVKRLQNELKAIDPEGAERIGISLKGLGDREQTAADKKNKPYEDIMEQADEAREFARNPSPTNDFGLLMDFIGVTKPESVGKLRLNQNEIQLVLGTRSSMGDLEALGNKIANGQLLTPKQRNDMLNTIGIMENHAKNRLGGQPATTGTTVTPQPPKAADPGMKWQHKTENGNIQWRQVPTQ
jgi:hypothetical protein